MSTLGKNIKKRREELGITQEELANKLGYKSKSTINKIENGTNDIPQSKISAFASALDTTEGKLMGWNEEERLEKARQEIFEDEDMKLLFNLKKGAQAVTEEVKDDITYFVVLVSTWVAGGILALFIYGMGKIYELQENINYHLQEIDDKLNKTP